MKIIYYFILVVSLSVSGYTVYSQDSKPVKASFKVEGVCNQCKERIENAAYLKGVKSCSWDKTTEMLTVVYVPGKIDLESIQKNIAAAGHDTEKFVADSAAYAKLPKCCAYRDGIHKH